MDHDPRPFEPSPEARPVLDDATFDQLGAALVWRVGRTIDEGPVTVRVGFATSAALFADLPRLRSASDEEIQQAIADGSVQVEWVGPRAR
jgi:hypothetical protein